MEVQFLSFFSQDTFFLTLKTPGHKWVPSMGSLKSRMSQDKVDVGWQGLERWMHGNTTYDSSQQSMQM